MTSPIEPPQHPGVDRRGFLLTSLAGALAAPLAAKGQQAAKVARVPLIYTTSPVSEMAGPEPSHWGARNLIRALRQQGWVEGRNLILERRSAEGHPERYESILREMVGLKCDLILTNGTPMARSRSA